MADLNEINIRFDRRTILEPVKNSGFIRFASTKNVFRRPPRLNQIAVLIKQAIPLRDSIDRLTKIFVISNRDMNRIQISLTHLLKNIA